MAVNADVNLLGMIRKRTEEEELKQHLKATVGGYSKSSVMEYLAELRQRQQCTNETFNQNLQSLLEEKENLKSENEKLLMQIAQAKADFLRLAEAKKQQGENKVDAAHGTEEAKKQQEQDKPGSANDNIVYLKSNAKSTESSGTTLKATDRAPENGRGVQNREISEKEAEWKKEIDVLKNMIFERDAELEKSKLEVKEQKELLALEELEAEKQRELASELSVAAEELQGELQYLKERFSEEKFTALNEQISELTVGVAQRDEVILQLNNQTADQDGRIKYLLDENVTMMKSMECMSNSLDDMAVQNEKLLMANNALAQAFEDESKKVVKLINDISEETVEKLILERKLEEAFNHSSSEESGTSQSDENETSKDADSKSSIA